MKHIPGTPVPNGMLINLETGELYYQNADHEERYAEAIKVSGGNTSFAKWHAHRMTTSLTAEESWAEFNRIHAYADMMEGRGRG